MKIAIGLHSHWKRNWYKYFIPVHLNPITDPNKVFPIYRWLFWYISWDNESSHCYYNEFNPYPDLDKFCDCVRYSHEGTSMWCPVHASIDEYVDPRAVVSLREYLNKLVNRESALGEAAGAVYQVMGSLLSDTNLFETEKGQLVLDTLSWMSGSDIDKPDFDKLLPWYSIEKGINEEDWKLNKR